MFSQIIMYLCY